MSKPAKCSARLWPLAEPNNNQSKRKVCSACTGADKDKPIVGLVILRDFNSNGDRYKGTIMDPNDGKV